MCVLLYFFFGLLFIILLSITLSRRSYKRTTVSGNQLNEDEQRITNQYEIHRCKMEDYTHFKQNNERKIRPNFIFISIFISIEPCR